ncbi:MAG TPA: glycosyltransferase family 39 protein, partial [Vicinamibacterales bacterium]|nr:glycosyltransferase family 39 protein [Vicinamibacterales bacterium]
MTATTESRRIDFVILAAILIIGGWFRVWALTFGLPHDFTRPDEEVIVGPALKMLHGDLNPHFFIYPTLFIYANAVALAAIFGWERLTGETHTLAEFASRVDPSLLHLTGRALSAGAGVATIAVLYFAARELFSRRTALTSATLLAVSYLHVRDSHFGVTDVPLTLLVVGTFWSAARCAMRGASPFRVATAGLLSGLATATKYNAALTIAPVLVAILADLPTRGARRISISVAVAFICQVAGFLFATPFAVLDSRAFLADVGVVSRTLFTGQYSGAIDPANVVWGERGWIHHLTFNLRYGLGLPLLIVGLTGLCWLAFERSRRGAVVVAFPLVYYAAIGGTFEVFARYMTPIVPFLCLTAAVSIDRVASTVEGMTTRHGTLSSEETGRRGVLRRLSVPMVVATLVLVTGAPTAADSIAFDRLMSRPDTRVLAAQWIESRYPMGTTIYQSGPLYGHAQLRRRDRYPQIGFDGHDGLFKDGMHPVEPPRLVLRIESPLVLFSQVPDTLDERLAT